MAVQGRLRPSERAPCQLVWSEGDNWIPYFTAHMEAIRAKYFPSSVKPKGEAEAMATVDEKLPQEELPPQPLSPRLGSRMSAKMSTKMSGRVHPLQARTLLVICLLWNHVGACSACNAQQPARKQAA